MKTQLFKGKKSVFLLSGIATLSLGLCSCTTTGYGPNAKINSVMGGIVGAGIGAAIGEHKGRELEGAAIGAVIGSTAGQTIGSASDDIIAARNGTAVPPQSYNGAPLYTSNTRVSSGIYHAPISTIAPIILSGSYHYGSPRYRSYGYNRGYGDRYCRVSPRRIHRNYYSHPRQYRRSSRGSICY